MGGIKRDVIMMSDYSAAEKHSCNDLKNNKSKDVKKSLNNYLNQLKFHFDLSDVDISELLAFTLESRKRNKSKKKWWQIWE